MCVGLLLSLLSVVNLWCLVCNRFLWFFDNLFCNCGGIGRRNRLGMGRHAGNGVFVRCKFGGRLALVNKLD